MQRNVKRNNVWCGRQRLLTRPLYLRCLPVSSEVSSSSPFSCSAIMHAYSWARPNSTRTSSSDTTARINWQHLTTTWAYRWLHYLNRHIKMRRKNIFYPATTVNLGQWIFFISFFIYFCLHFTSAWLRVGGDSRSLRIRAANLKLAINDSRLFSCILQLWHNTFSTKVTVLNEESCNQQM